MRSRARGFLLSALLVAGCVDPSAKGPQVAAVSPGMATRTTAPASPALIPSIPPPPSPAPAGNHTVIAQIQDVAPWIRLASPSEVTLAVYYYHKDGDPELFIDGQKIRVTYQLATVDGDQPGDALAHGSFVMTQTTQQQSVTLNSPVSAKSLYVTLDARLPDNRDIRSAGVVPFS